MLHDVFSMTGDGGVVESSCSYTLYDALEHRHTYIKVIKSKYNYQPSKSSVCALEGTFSFLNCSR